MLTTIRKGLAVWVAFVFFILYTIWFISFNLPGKELGAQYDWFTVTYGLMALWGSIWGVIIAKKWGWIHSLMGKCILFFSAGLFFQELGQLAYTYYIYFLGIEIPYPSIGDFFFYGTIPFYIAAIIYLSKAAGVQISMRTFGSKIQAVLIPVTMLLMSYFMFLQEYQFNWSQPLVIFLDFLVPLVQAIYISMAILTYTLTRGILGGIMKKRVLLILFALTAQYIADWTFLFQASRGIWSVSGINDYMFLCAYFLMTIGLLRLKTVYDQLHEN